MYDTPLYHFLLLSPLPDLQLPSQNTLLLTLAHGILHRTSHSAISIEVLANSTILTERSTDLVYGAADGAAGCEGRADGAVLREDGCAGTGGFLACWCLWIVC